MILFSFKLLFKISDVLDIKVSVKGLNNKSTKPEKNRNIIIVFFLRYISKDKKCVILKFIKLLNKIWKCLRIALIIFYVY